MESERPTLETQDSTDDIYEDDYDENAVMPPTPGPWTIDEDSGWYIRISAPDPDPNNHMLGRLEARVETDDIDSRVSRANARLMAAAPGLLNALTWAVEWMEAYEGETMPEWREWAVRGRAALEDAAQPAGEAQP